jgi:hypothetical protein
MPTAFVGAILFSSNVNVFARPGIVAAARGTFGWLELCVKSVEIRRCHENLNPLVGSETISSGKILLTVLSPEARPGVA